MEIYGPEHENQRCNYSENKCVGKVVIQGQLNRIPVILQIWYYKAASLKDLKKEIFTSLI